MHGKAPVGVARAATATTGTVRSWAAAGRCTLTEAELHRVGIAWTYALTELEPDLARCIASARPLLERVAEHIAADWLA